MSNIRSKKRNYNKKQSKTYRFTDDKYKKIGCKGYQHYLSTGLWKGIRDKVHKLYNDQCVCCRDNADVTHHIDYDLDTLKGRNLDRIVPLCTRCHVEIETYSKSLGAKESKLYEMRTVFID